MVVVDGGERTQCRLASIASLIRCGSFDECGTQVEHK